MNSAETKIDRQVQLWALTGPMIALLSSSLILFKAPSHATYLMIGLLIGLPACWWAKWRGLAVSFGVLAALFVFNYSGIPAGQKLWHLGMVTSLLICFAVTSLSLEEAESVLEQPEIDEAQQNKILAMQKVQEEQLIEINQHKELLGIAQQEVITHQSELEALKQEISLKTHNYSKLEEKYTELAQRFSAQQEQFSKAGQEMKYFQDRLQSMHGELQAAKIETQTAKSELSNSRRQVEELELEVHKAREVSEVYAKAHEEQMVRESQSHEMAEHMETLLKEREHLRSAIERLQTDYHSLQAQHQTEMKNAAESSELEKMLLQEELNLSKKEKELFQKEFQDVKHKSLLTNEDMQRLNSEKMVLQVNLNDLQATHEKLLSEYVCSQQEKNTLQANVNSLQVTCKQLHADLTKSQQEIHRLLTEKEAAEAKLAGIQAEAERQNQHVLQEKESLQQHINALQTELDHSREQQKQRAVDYAELNATLANLQNKADQLSIEKERSLQELQMLRAERDLMAREVRENGHTFEGVSSEANAWRQAEAKYTQLQGQFAEKSAVLDATRRELFLTQEKLLQLQKEMEENQTYAINEAEAALTQQLIQLDKQAKSEFADYQKEIVALQEIITALMRST